MIVDRHGRQFRNLRVSLTAACNYACTYCVPNGKRLQAAAHELSSAQLLQAVGLLVDAGGIEKLRITGGEPLLSPKLEDFLPGVMQLGLQDVAMTSNGQLITRYQDLLLSSGLKRMNVSLDTLDTLAFPKIARGGDLKTVLAGIDLLMANNWKLKINMVPMRRSNIDQVLPLLKFSLERGIELRFIELMNMGHLKTSNQYQQDFVGLEELLEIVGREYEFAQTDAPFDSTAIRYEIPGQGYFGIIANESAPFCRSCTRLRLASNGHLYGCLSNSTYQDMTPILPLPVPEALVQVQQMLSSALTHKQDLNFQGEVTVMKFIGG